MPEVLPAAEVANGRVRYQEEVTGGLENAPQAFMGMLEGRNFGKALVRVASAVGTPSTTNGA
ncbi:hypothetical protein [Granulicella mallensis]|uniref:NADPH-dependent curcumin reductase CurA n=1 Tax=Granulicella mallensis TaxID=940614 RepID=A0A7W7ZQR2_9BACT|nr:hypothetical protein [Granulicella mallensis]MBB5064405.1 NADPH-dependent curcumin reductase CurA [Granulicella mallensis]